MTYYEFDRLADRHGFLAVYPDGFEQHWNDCRAAATYSANTKNIDDVAFFGKMIDFFVAEQHANPDRVYATGISNGGQLAYRLALELPDRIAAVAPVAASLPDDANLDCEKSGKPVAILVLNGTEDPMNPYEGGEVALYGLWGSRGTVLSTDATIRYFAELAGHRGPPRVVAVPRRQHARSLARRAADLERRRRPRGRAAQGRRRRPHLRAPVPPLPALHRRHQRRPRRGRGDLALLHRQAPR